MTESDIGQPPNVPTQGTLTPGVFPALFRDLYLNRRTGTLRLSRGNEVGTIYFADGHIVFGGANIQECLMGETLVGQGLIGREQLEQALEASRGTGRRLGDALLALGHLDREGLDRGLALHVREILRCVFSWSDGSYAFEVSDAQAPREWDRALPLSTAEVILDAVWSLPDAMIQEALGSLDQILVPSGDPLLRFQRVELSPADGLLLSRADGTLTLREILEIADASREEVGRRLFGLLCIGMIEPAAPRPGAAVAPPAEPALPTPALPLDELRRSVLEAHRRLTTRDPHKILGLGSEATPAEIKATYFQLVRALHPDTQHDPALAGLRVELQAAFARVNEAYRFLTTAGPTRPEPQPGSAEPPRPAPAQPPRPASVEAPEDVVLPVAAALAKAEESFSSGSYWEALAQAQAALGRAEGPERHHARMLIARAYMRLPDRAHEAEQELRAAVHEDPHDAEGYFLLGLLYAGTGDAGRAGMMFRRTLAVDPGHAGALAKAREPAAGPPPRKGLLARLTKRSRS